MRTKTFDAYHSRQCFFYCAQRHRVNSYDEREEVIQISKSFDIMLRIISFQPIDVPIDGRTMQYRNTNQC